MKTEQDLINELDAIAGVPQEDIGDALNAALDFCRKHPYPSQAELDECIKIIKPLMPKKR